jgi:hypothetical protein
MPRVLTFSRALTPFDLGFLGFSFSRASFAGRFPSEEGMVRVAARAAARDSSRDRKYVVSTVKLCQTR